MRLWIGSRRPATACTLMDRTLVPPERLLAHEVDRALFKVVWAAEAEGLLLDAHFRVDGTLVGAAASLKSIRPTKGPPPPLD